MAGEKVLKELYDEELSEDRMIYTKKRLGNLGCINFAF